MPGTPDDYSIPEKRRRRVDTKHQLIRKQLTIEKQEKAYALYNKGLSIKQLAKKYSRKPSTIQFWIRQCRFRLEEEGVIDGRYI